MSKRSIRKRRHHVVFERGAPVPSVILGEGDTITYEVAGAGNAVDAFRRIERTAMKASVTLGLGAEEPDFVVNANGDFPIVDGRPELVERIAKRIEDEAERRRGSTKET